jgi:hypothetical protein
MSASVPALALELARLIYRSGRFALTNFPTTQIVVRTAIVLIIPIVGVGTKLLSLAQSRPVELSHPVGSPPSNSRFGAQDKPMLDIAGPR